MIHFHFPKSFILFILFIGLIVLHAWARLMRRRDLNKLGDWKLLQQLIDIQALLRRRKKETMALWGVLFLILATTGPQFGTRLKEVKQRGVDVFIALDTSRSMLAEDVQPSRIEKAKRSLGLLLKKLEGNRTGIIAFAKEAVIQCPLTVDTEASRMFLEILDETSVPLQGTSIGDAIRLALKSFPKDDKTGRAIVLLTDGEDHQSEPIEAAKQAKDAGVVIFTIGIGTTKGEVIKNRNEQGQVIEFHKYKGEMVVSRMDDDALTKIALLTGGRYYRASSTDSEIDEIADIINGFDKKEFSSKLHERFQERYQFFAFTAFLILLVEFFIGERPKQWRRLTSFLSNRILSLILICILAPQLSWADIRSQIQKGNQLLKKGDIAGARREFESARIDAPEEAVIPYNIAATYYLESNMEEAKKFYEQAMLLAKSNDLKSKIAYNWGHLLFNMNERVAAIEKFKDSLRFNPKDVDAKYNIEYIKAGHKPPAAPPQQQNQDNQKSEQDKKDGKGQENKKEDSHEKNNNSENQSENMSKEDAERILEMLQAQESEKIKNSKPINANTFKNDAKKKAVAGEDW